jgi:Galactose-3-O-sulfotransferase
MIPPFHFGFHVFLSILLIAQIVFLFIRIFIDSCEQNANFQQQQLDHDHHKGRSTGVFKIRAERLPNGFNLSSIFQKSSSLGIPIHYPPQSKDENRSGVILSKRLYPRSFPRWNHHFPCFEPESHWFETSVQRTPTREGFFFLKELKAGSSTLSGVHLRISKNMAQRHTNYRICKARFDHSPAVILQYGNRQRSKSFLWTVLREPTKRAISQFFHFQVSREKVEPSDTNFQKYLAESLFDNYYLQSMSMEYLFRQDYNIEEVIAKVLRDYDFIGILERMDESLVVLSLILNVPITDVLYLKAKGSGGFDDGRYNRKCTYIIPPYVSPSMQSYFLSHTWKDRIFGDVYLYELVNKSLDLTIDEIGKDLVMQRLIEYRQLQKIAEDVCSDEALFPCDSGGQANPKAPGCLWKDSGCGHDCLNNIADKSNDLKSNQKESQ